MEIDYIVITAPCVYESRQVTKADEATTSASTPDNPVSIPSPKLIDSAHRRLNSISRRRCWNCWRRSIDLVTPSMTSTAARGRICQVASTSSLVHSIWSKLQLNKSTLLSRTARVNCSSVRHVVGLLHALHCPQNDTDHHWYCTLWLQSTLTDLDNFCQKCCLENKQGRLKMHDLKCRTGKWRTTSQGIAGSGKCRTGKWRTTF